MTRRRTAILAAMLAVNAATAALAQDSNEFWPEAQFHYWFDDRTRAIAMAAVSRDMGSNTNYQAEEGLTLEHRFADFLLGRIGYRHGGATDGDPFNENRLLTEQTLRLHLPSLVIVDVRNRQDFRWLDTLHRMDAYIGINSDWVNVETIIRTAPDQIAIGPGSLLREWEENGRRCFHYKLDHASFNFYSFLSARYEVARRDWKGVKLEVYYQPGHDFNVPRMLTAMEKSLEYFTANFGPYYHKQCRIIEFPRFSSFAQSFPGTMPYSESRY